MMGHWQVQHIYGGEMMRKKYFLMLIAIIVFLSLSSSTRGESTTNTYADNIVINEVFYPAENITPWFELYNPTNRTINITGWLVWFYSINGPVYLPYISISPQEYVIICFSEESFTKRWYLPSGTRIFEIQFGLPYDSLHITDSIIDGPGTWIDGVPEEGGIKVPSLPANHSWARYKGDMIQNFTNDFYDEATPTPGYENTKAKTITLPESEKSEEKKFIPFLEVAVDLVVIVSVCMIIMLMRRQR
jgi:hypothetical protein